MRIKKHDRAYIVVLEDGSEWRIWPADLAATLHWLPSTDLEVHEIDDDEHWTHALVDRANGTCVRVIEAAEEWVPEQIEASLVS
jgi:hypothetical protein